MVGGNQAPVISEAAKHAVPASKRWPVSVYRLNFTPSFTFRDAADVVPYLHDLGVTDCYCSPYLKARPGSPHGYDVTDHGRLNPEIGTRAEYNRFVRSLREHGMGQIMDFIPNHMSIFDNPRWLDVLENGPSSTSARFFDIDWEPVKAELRGKVLLPVLEDLYGKVLQSGRITLGFRSGGFVIAYRGFRLPVGPKTAVVVLEGCLASLERRLGKEHPDCLELQSIAMACRNLPDRGDRDPGKIAERQREKEITRKRLRTLHSRNREVRKVVSREIRSFNGVLGDNSSFARLHDLLEQQAYRLSYWRVAAEEINYRRFFDINELVSIRMEDHTVFDESHRLVRELLAKKAVTGIRIDHVDGLFDPAEYLWRLQKAHWLDLVGARLSRSLRSRRLTADGLSERLSYLYEVERQKNPDSTFLRPLYVVVEKILGESEKLRETWPADGTTGYEFMATLCRLFVDSANNRSLMHAYRQFTGSRLTFDEVMYRCKNLVMRTGLSAEVNLLAHRLSRIAEGSWQHRDFTLNSLRDALREVMASFPVYRTYIDAHRESIDERDRSAISVAVNRARRRNPAVSSAVFDFVRDTLLLQYAVGMSEDGRDEQRLFVMRFQQLTGPVMAKGVEDTAFYVYHPLLSLNDVGGGPQTLGGSLQEFHRQNRLRDRNLPHSFISTSTHDSKRGEDVRARLNVLSEMPKEWRAALKRWSQLNWERKVQVNGDRAPDGNEEYFIYQTLLGTCPLHPMDRQEAESYLARILQYVQKAIREAKVHTSWINPNPAHEEGVAGFTRGILDPTVSGEFLSAFRQFLGPVAECGIYNSLSQVVLKLASPGVPDIYQGNELWALSLTDPDNRRPVDFERRRQILEEMKRRAASTKQLTEFAEELMETRENGLIKLYVTWKALSFRRGHAGLFGAGNYLPLRAIGTKRDHVCAFAWREAGHAIVVAAPRLVAGLTGAGAIEPLGEAAWGDTRLVLPWKAGDSTFRNIFTGEMIRPVQRAGPAGLALADVLAHFPVAMLEYSPR